jgi:DNA-binding response OmpR family regulator
MAMGLRDNLQFEGYQVQVISDGAKAVKWILEEKPALVLLDVMLPGMDGFKVCQLLRESGFSSPILMLTARGQEIDKVRGLELGADDYITKPFGVRELLARIKAALRRFKPPSTAHLEDAEIDLDGIKISFSINRITRGRKNIPMGHFESEILKMLISRSGEIIDRVTMLKEIWGLENEPMNRSVDNHIVSLRRKIETNPAKPKHILTVHGFGYKFVP